MAICGLFHIAHKHFTVFVKNSDRREPSTNLRFTIPVISRPHDLRITPMEIPSTVRSTPSQVLEKVCECGRNVQASCFKWKKLQNLVLNTFNTTLKNFYMSVTVSSSHQSRTNSQVLGTFEFSPPGDVANHWSDQNDANNKKSSKTCKTAQKGLVCRVVLVLEMCGDQRARR
jgi:hypothetical protein